MGHNELWSGLYELAHDNQIPSITTRENNTINNIIYGNVNPILCLAASLRFPREFVQVMPCGEDRGARREQCKATGDELIYKQTPTTRRYFAHIHELKLLNWSLHIRFSSYPILAIVLYIKFCLRVINKLHYVLRLVPQ